MSDPSSPPRPERDGLLGSFALSSACGLAALAASAALVASAHSLGRAPELLLVFVVLTALECVAYAQAIRPWLDGEDVPSRGQLVQVGVVVLALLVFLEGSDLGLVGLCGLAAGVFLSNASNIRYRRVNRDLADAGEPWLAEQGAPEAAARVLTDGEPPESAQESVQETPPERVRETPPEPSGERDHEPDRPPPERAVRARPVPKVGRVLLAASDQERDRWLAWAAATLAVTLACVAAGVPGTVILGVDFLGVAALAWVTRRLLCARLAQRDFEEALTEPRLAYVVVLRNASPRGTGPLLGIWDKEPVLAGGRLPRADAVYRCDPGRDALFSGRGALVVHRAWVNRGPRPGTRPRWVAADAGVALPRHRALLGTQHLDSLIGKERPARARALTMPAPNPTTEAETGIFVTVINEPERPSNQVAWMFARRVAALAVAAGAIGWWQGR